MRKSIVYLAVCALGVCLWTQAADAQSGINRVNILTFEPTTSPYGILTTDTARTQGHLKWYVGAYFGYAYDPFRAIIDDNRPVHSFVHHHVPADLVASLGIWKYFEVGLHLPFVLYQAPKGDADPLGMGDRAIRKGAVGDLRIVPKVRFWKNTGHGFGLAFIAQFTVPTGFEKDNAGERFMTFEPKLVADYTFKQGTVIALNTGVRMRNRTDIIRLRNDDEFYYSLGADINVYRRQVSVLAELFGSVGFSDAPGDPTKALDPEEAPLELLAAVRYRAPFGLIVTGGAGVGLTDGWSTPAFRVFVGVGYSPVAKRKPKVKPRPKPKPKPRRRVAARPKDKDSDGDGLVDRLDKCPRRAEDKDGFEDSDGCPDPDNDKDKICDGNDSIQKSLSRWAPICKGSDKCPDKPETYNGFEDEDGCPDKKPPPPLIPRVLRIGKKAHFAKSRWWIDKAAAKALRHVAKLMRKHRHIKLLEIAGHADERGTDAYNVRISRNRARAVRFYLIRRGVSGKRLVAKGYGRSQPIQRGCRSLSTPLAQQQCWRKNRRVVFTILKSSP